MDDKGCNNVLITGGAGFIGSYVCKLILGLGYQPVVLDAFIQYISPFESSYQKYLEYRFKDTKSRIIFERGDTRDKNDVRRLMSLYKPQYIIHLAALPIADLSYTHPQEAISSIINATVNILDTINEHNFVKRFVYISSSMVYGDFKEIPAPEDHPKSPKDIYGGTKLAGEILTETYSRRFGIKYTIIRPSAVYGPTDVNRRVSQVFIENAMKGEKLIVHGGGENILDFTYVEDIAQGIVKATFSPGGENQIFNITRGQGRSLLEYAELLRKYFPKLEIQTKPFIVYRPKRGALSIKKAQELTGYSPMYCLEDGLDHYIDFMRELEDCK
ncbi:MAG: NAD-dependent epimerase/dehydratase family protein [Nitrospirae bacterium]|nr:NAD-dependent epimerase/dehydratase family protein [Nitrospirota bacterium]MBF0535791.1 NAD-dependent epimerase/dehydratase family protein [Nitrospirota bacterium]MBF0617668.1 NAD-dependent epimerase/dehydratase family protein [Nitrospirota bacterium]